jgi:SulP family sulfate permease
MEIFSGHKEDTLNDLEACMEIRTYEADEVIYPRGSPGDELFWVRRGTVRLVASLQDGKKKPVASFARGDFFGGMSFLENKPRPNDAITVTRTEVYVLSRQNFRMISDQHKKLAFNLVRVMAHTLATRLRRLEVKYTMLQEY